MLIKYKCREANKKIFGVVLAWDETYGFDVVSPGILSAGIEEQIRGVRTEPRAGVSNLDGRFTAGHAVVVI